MRATTTALLAGGLLAAVALTGCGGSPTGSTSTATTAPTSSASTDQGSAPASTAAAAPKSCGEFKKLLGNEQVQALIAGVQDGNIQDLVANGKELAPLLGDFMSDLPSDTPADIKGNLTNIAGLLASGALAGNLSSDELAQLNDNTEAVITWATTVCGATGESVE